MLVVKIEIWPLGHEDQAEEIGRMLIHNRGDHKNRPRRGNYGVRLMRKGAARTVQRTAEVLDYPRLSYPVWKLVRRALEALDV